MAAESGIDKEKRCMRSVRNIKKELNPDIA